MTQVLQSAQVSKSSTCQRLVVFVGGFDPRGARHYHQLMRKEAAAQSQVAGMEYVVGARSVWGNSNRSEVEGKHATWSVSAKGGARCDYVFVDWSDQVRRNWQKQTWQVWADAWNTYVAVLRKKEILAPLHRETPFVVWTFFYPLAFAMLCVMVALSVGWLANTALGQEGLWAGLVASLMIMWVGYKLDQLLHVSWLLRILNFAHKAAQQPLPDLEQRWAQTADTIVKQLRHGQYQELVVVGFSVGSVQAVILVHALQQRMQQSQQSSQQSQPLKPEAQPAVAPRVHLLTLGNCIPLFTLMPPQASSTLRNALFALAQDENLHWVDISSPSDSVSFGMCNLLTLSLPQAQAEDLQRCINPRHMCSPRFHTLFQPTTYRWLRRNKMRMHFQYLMASELPGAYDYFALLTCQGSVMDFISKRLVR